jgi:hypothetical protein
MLENRVETMTFVSEQANSEQEDRLTLAALRVTRCIGLWLCCGAGVSRLPALESRVSRLVTQVDLVIPYLVPLQIRVQL